MKKVLVVFAFAVLWACADTSISEDDLHYLNGYWEISAVEFSDGTQKSYTVNPSIDFILWENGKGFRKKVHPQLDGTYNTSRDAEAFTMNHVDNVYTLHYKSNLSEWEETLIQLDSISFSVRNEAGIVYYYKRFQPISIPK